MAASKIKASDRSKACQQIVTALKKEYGSKQPSNDHDVLDTLLYSICLESATVANAEASMQRLKDLFFDYNELRVSSITEIQNAFLDVSEPEWRAMRVKDTLQFVFENGYSYEIEDLKKKTMDAAEKHLKKIKSLTPFNISHTLLFALGSHVVPVSDSMLNGGIWLGLLEPKTKLKAASDQLKGAIRKSDVPLFYSLLSQFTSDSKYSPFFENEELAELEEDSLVRLTSSAAKLKNLLAGKLKNKPAKKEAPAKKSSSKTSGAKKETTKKTATTKKKTASKTAKKSAPVSKKAASKKTVKKAAAPKKKTAKKAAPKKATKKKTTKKAKKK